jgi:hypothetical protein
MAETAFGFGSRQPGRAPSREDADLDSGRYCSLYVPMPIETLKDALSAGWRVHARCIGGQVDNTRARRRSAAIAPSWTSRRWCGRAGAGVASGASLSRRPAHALK